MKRHTKKLLSIATQQGASRHDRFSVVVVNQQKIVLPPVERGHSSKRDRRKLRKR